ncbi:MAG TPA: cytochrome c [Candidatus Sulfotelmatobacter sp.]|nr:cytochrome c [Candidatus Sulfotelmatobacter sp.]
MLLLAASVILVLSGCRQDMHNQPRFIPLRSSEFYPDHRSARYPVPGTVPRLEDANIDREQLDPGSYYLSGKHGNVYGNDLPLQAPLKDVLQRGEQRFNIYCTPCHSLVGDGNGMIVQRGFKRPPSFHQQRLRNAPLGYFYEIIGNGFGSMPDYAAQVRPADRWAIAAYIRALQLSQSASEADVPPQDREKLSKAGEDQIAIPDTSLINPASTTPRRPVAESTPKGDKR